MVKKDDSNYGADVILPREIIRVVDNSRRIPVNKHKKTGLSTSKEI
jgi:DNA gyrase/topoisomerase IV subunit B